MKPLLRAEQAVLGAVLLDPGQLDALSSWLSPGHFYRPAHRAVFTAMLKLRADGHPALAAGPEVPVAWVTDIVGEATRHTRGLTASYAHTLIATCPKSANAPVYGRMVLEGAIHRSVLEHATRLHQAARADALQGEVTATLHHAQVLGDVLADLSRRWGTDPRPVPPPEQRTPAAPAPVVSDEQAADEQFLLGVLVDRPEALDEVVGWLRPGDFADHGHGQLYRCLGALHHRGEPIDALTVQWEAQRRGLFADGTLTTDQVSALCDGINAGSAEYLGERIIGSALVRTAAVSARTIQELAGDESLAPGRLIGHALHALGPLGEVHSRWRTATGSITPGATAPAVAPVATRVEAALARSRPRQPPQPPPRASPANHPTTRTPARSHT